MSIVRLEKTGNYSQVRNGLWTDKRLTPNARFILGYMLSMPEDWKFNIGWMAAQLGMNRDTVSKYINELIDKCYIVRTRDRNEDGTFGDYMYVVYEVPELNPVVGISEDLGYQNDTLSDIKANMENPYMPTYAEESGTGDFRTTNTDVNKTNKKIVVVEYPSAIIEALSRHNLTVNAATLKRWLSLASEEVIVQVIDYAVNQKSISNLIGYITAIMQQGYVRAHVPNGTPEQRQKSKRRDNTKRIEQLPSYIVDQLARGTDEETEDVGEDKLMRAERLLRALGEA
jgi:predicted transcriptional regulator